jgi:hypothetical protein
MMSHAATTHRWPPNLATTRPWAAVLSFIAALSCWAVSTDAAHAQTTAQVPRRIEEFLRSCETSRKGAIARLEYELRGLRAEKSPTAATARRVRTVEANLRALHANKEPVVPALHFPPEVGDIGRLPQLTCHVEQILSKDQMRVQCHFSLKVRTVRNFQPRLETIVRPVTFLIDGLPTSRVTEGADAPFLDVFEISAERSYQSVSGKKISVLVLSPFDMKAIEPYFRAMSTGR